METKNGTHQSYDLDGCFYTIRKKKCLRSFEGAFSNSLFKETDWTAGITNRNTICGNGAVDNTSCTVHAVCPNRHSRQQDRAAARMMEYEYAAVLRDRIIELRGERK